MYPSRPAKPLTADQLRKFMESRTETAYTLVDVRQEAEFLQERLPGAVHIPVGELEARLPSLPPDRDYVLYCQVGARSAAAALLVEEMQHITGTVYTLTGGLSTWSGYAVAEAPRVSVFNENARPHTLLMQAIEMEKAAYLLYTTVRDSPAREKLCELMDSLIEVEIAHAKSIYRRLQKHATLRQQEDAKVLPLPEFDALFQSMKGSILEGGLTLEELQPWIQSAISGSCYDVADLALELEMNAYDLYRTLAHRARMREGHFPETDRPASTASAEEREKSSLPPLAETRLSATELAAKQQADAGDDSSAPIGEIEKMYLDLAQQEKHHARMILRYMDAFEE